MFIQQFFFRVWNFYIKWKKYAQHLLRRIPVNLFCARVAALKSLLIQGKFLWMPYLIADMMMSTVYTIELLGIWPHLMNLFTCMFIIYSISGLKFWQPLQDYSISKNDMNVGHRAVIWYCKKYDMWFLNVIGWHKIQRKLFGTLHKYFDPQI